jgi:signal transduction histidine kinase
MQLIQSAVGIHEAEGRRAQGGSRAPATGDVEGELLTGENRKGESLEEVAHDARNMITTLGLYCDLLEEPGVLNAPFAHYGSELRLVADASRRLVQKLVSLDARPTSRNPAASSLLGGLTRNLPAAEGSSAGFHPLWELLPSGPIESMAAEIAANRSLLAALAGPQISVGVTVEGAALPVDLTGEDLTRILVNLVRNAADAMPGGGRIDMDLAETCHSEGSCGNAGCTWLRLTVTDNGAGIPAELHERVFESGFSSHETVSSDGWAPRHRGLGLSITRSILEAAGGSIRVIQARGGGASFEIDLPVRRHEGVPH